MPEALHARPRRPGPLNRALRSTVHALSWYWLLTYLLLLGQVLMAVLPAEQTQPWGYTTLQLITAPAAYQ